MDRETLVQQEVRAWQARRWRNIALAIALGTLVVLFFVMTMVRVKP